MASKDAGLSGTLYVALVVLGLLILIGVIVWMMRAQPGIRHSPERGSVNAPRVSVAKMARAPCAIAGIASNLKAETYI